MYNKPTPCKTTKQYKNKVLTEILYYFNQIAHSFMPVKLRK